MKQTNMLQQKAYDHLINAIKNGDLVQDKIYSLNQVCQEIGISKTPLRDAVLLLEQEKYIDILPSKGFQLHKMTSQDIVETYQLREAIELYCFKQLCMNFNTERGALYYAKLLGKVNSQREIMESNKDPNAFAKKDYEFHLSVIQFVDNETMIELYGQFMYRISWLNATSFSREGRMSDTVKEHEDILQKIRELDYEGLETFLASHLSTAKNINMDLL